MTQPTVVPLQWKFKCRLCVVSPAGLSNIEIPGFLWPRKRGRAEMRRQNQREAEGIGGGKRLSCVTVACLICRREADLQPSAGIVIAHL